jgi:hypothetical protein
MSTALAGRTVYQCQYICIHRHHREYQCHHPTRLPRTLGTHYLMDAMGILNLLVNTSDVTPEPFGASIGNTGPGYTPRVSTILSGVWKSVLFPKFAASSLLLTQLIAPARAWQSTYEWCPRLGSKQQFCILSIDAELMDAVKK